MAKADATKSDEITGFSANFGTNLTGYDGKVIEHDGPVFPDVIRDAVRGGVLEPMEAEALISRYVAKKPSRPMALGFLCMMALDAELDTDRSAPVDAKIKRGLLAEYIYGATERKKPVPLTSEEVSLLKDRLSKIAQSRAMLAAVRLLDPNAAQARAAP